MIVKLLITIIVLLMFTLWTTRSTLATEEEAPIGKPGCQTLCGNVSIPYPFGIGDTHCYIDKWFEIVCTNSTNTLHRPFLKRINLEAVNISIDEGTVMVRNPVTFSNSKDRDTATKNMSENPFVFSSTKNVFVAASCGYLALLTSNSSTDTAISYTSVGCSSTCSKPSTNDSCLGATRVVNNGCHGINCCKTTIPSPVKDFKISFHNSEIIERLTECNYAFLVDQNSFSMGFKELDYVPVIMEWYLTHSEFEIFGTRLENHSTTHCHHAEHNEPFDEPALPRIKCRCKSGFRGNPYILDGCQDINECEEVNENNCGSRICVNKIGRFECHEPKSKLVLIGAIGALGAFVLLVIGAYGLYKAIKNRKDTRHKQNLFKRNGGLLLQKCLSSGEANVKKTRVFNSNELDKATDHFSVNRIVGQGGHGTVYKGMLADGRIVAIKKPKIQDQEKVTEFINEVVILSQISHRNVVKLLGCCLETEVPLLVYEFIPNGTLFEYLHNQNEEIIPLTWKLRLQIAVEIAGALSYLHSAASIPIYHRDIKSTNILLDEKYRAKIADFGTSRSIAMDQTHLTTLIYGTFGYLDPEYFQSSQFTEKSDVYSFGVVIVELLTGQKPVSVTKSKQGLNLAAYFNQCMEDNCLLDTIDGRIAGNCQDIIAVANLAKRCLNSIGKNRPTMKQVAMELESIQRSVN